MEATCLQENASAAIGSLGRSLYSGQRSRGHNQILVAAADTSITFTATNGETFIEAVVPAIVNQPGSVNLPGRLFADYINTLADDKLLLTTTEEQPHILKMDCGQRQTARIHGGDPDIFPRFPEAATHYQAAIAPDALRKALRRTLFSAANEDARPALNTISLTFSPQGLTAASADGFRLTEQKVDLDEPPRETFTILAPLADLQEVERLLGRQDLPVQIAVTENKKLAHFRFASSRLACPLYVGNFPDYDALIPRKWHTRATFPRAQMQQHVNFAAAVAETEAAGIIRLNLNTPTGENDSFLRVRCQSPDHGDTAGEMTAEVEGYDGRIAFNAKYLREALNRLDDAEITMAITTETSPGVFRPKDERDRFVHVTMPMFVQWEEPAPEPPASERADQADPESPETTADDADDSDHAAVQTYTAGDAGLESGDPPDETAFLEEEPAEEEADPEEDSAAEADFLRDSQEADDEDEE